MQRFHVNLSVENIEQSVEFYTTLFATDPTVRRDDYAKWMLEDPRVNFAITTHGTGDGIDHVGIQSETEQEFTQMRDRLEAAGRPLLKQENTTCCYANSSKTWIRDPQGVAWETFITHGDSTVYGDSRALAFDNKDDDKDLANQKDADTAAPSTACCAPG